MKLFRIIILIYLTTGNQLLAQEHYTVDKTTFSSDRSDEFSPAIVGNRIVFCSNRHDELFITHITRDRKSLFKIFAVPIDDTTNKSKPVIFSKNLNTPFNDGPITFDRSGIRAIFSRNIETSTRKKVRIDKNDNLGLFSAELVNGEWTNIKPFQFNNDAYSNITPFLTTDGMYLYFASDRPGGYGGVDLYRCTYMDSTWSEPENLGKVINTNGNEAYPFVNSAGELFFASNGHPGLGKKDLFMSTESAAGWNIPLHLSQPINSQADDFGLVTDSVFTTGYFSSDRNGSDDIFKFETNIPQLYNCDTLKANKYCFQFWDNKYPGIDSLPVEYEWQFSDSTVIQGISVEHCFPGAGKYWALLKITDTTTGNTFITMDSIKFEIKDFEQPYITSKDTTEVSEETMFSGLKSNLPGVNIEEYIWDFGDGGFVTGPEVSHIYEKEGIYDVRLGINGKGKDEKTSKIYCIMKPLWVTSAKKDP